MWDSGAYSVLKAQWALWYVKEKIVTEQKKNANSLFVIIGHCKVI